MTADHHHHHGQAAEASDRRGGGGERTADLDPVPHPCTTSPGPCRRSVLLKRSEVRPYAEHVGTGVKR